MANIKIVTDGSCDFPQEVIDLVNPDIVRINVAFGEESFIGGVEITEEEFYEKMKKSDELPKTSSPSPNRFIEIYEKEDYEEIIVFTLTSKLSGTYSNAVIAKNMYEEKNGSNKRIEIIDTENGSIGVSLMLLKTQRMIEEGKSMDEILAEVDKMKKDIVFFGTLATLENAIKGGRVNPIAGKLINALNFKVIIKIDEGLVKPIDKARGESNSLKKLFEYVKKNVDVSDIEHKDIIIGHANCPHRAERIKKFIEEHYSFEKIMVAPIGPIMGTFTAEGAILVAVL
ncbi:DegV family protein [Peptacetobacter hominis]|uniref:DegV family protein n=1 Tax=Peptacetobacter hominis TaxID=2743610 RepID=A0A544QXL8_9FIRM|nr:DegV family protein [Peptacetobacter hominis]TQQ85476.1 DegV family protein [Peptacetobacter hominis]